MDIEPCIQLGLSTAFLNKTNLTGSKHAFGSSFIPSTISLDGFAAHVLSGKAWTQGFFNGRARNRAAFRSAQTLALDFDNGVSVEQAITNPFIRQYAYLVHPSPSSTPEHPKTRVIFILSEAVEAVGAWEALQRGLIRHFADLQPDEACKDAARLFYGSDRPGAVILGHRLPLEIAGALTIEEASDAFQQTQKPPRKPVDLSRRDEASRAEKYADTAKTRLLDELAQAAAGGRHNALKTVAPQAIAKHKGGWPGFERIDDDLRAVALGLGLPQREIDDLLRWAHENAQAQPLELPAQEKKTRRKPVPTRQRNLKSAPAPELEGLPVRYVSDDLTPDALRSEKTLLIAGGTGLGKTAAVAAYVTTLPPKTSITAIAQFRTLVLNLHNALPGTHHYEDADGANQRALGRVLQLATSVSSLHKFNRRGGICILDEIEGVVNFVASSTTFRGREALTAYRALKALVTCAEQLIGMDANLSEIVSRWIEDVRGGQVTVKRYCRATGRGKVTFLKNHAAAVFKVEKLLAHRRGQVYVACSSERKASDLAAYFTTQGYRVLKVTRDTSNTPAVKAATINANHERSAYDLVVYDAAWGAGVDISEPVYALVGIFDQKPLAPEDAIQLFGRVRNTRRRYAVVPADSEGYPTQNADELLYGKLLQYEQWTARKLHRSADANGDYLELARLWAQFEARRLRETAQWRRYFVQRLQADGFTVQANNASAPEAYAEKLTLWHQTRRDEDWQIVLAAAGQALADDEREKRRMAGEEITRALRLRNERYHIEMALAVEALTDRDRDLMRERQRDRFYRLCDLLAGEAHSLEADRAQAEEGRPLQSRHYRTAKHHALKKLLKLGGHRGSAEEAYRAFLDYFQVERSAAEVTARYHAFTAPEAMRLFEALGHREGNAQSVHGLCRWLVNAFGLKLNSRQRRTGEGKRAMFYQIDAETLAYRMARARRALQARGLSKKLRDTSHSFLDTAAQRTPPAQPTTHTNALLERLAAGKAVNPFSKAHELCRT